MSEPICRADLPKSQQPVVSALRSWRRFRCKHRNAGKPVLLDLPKYPNAVLVAGCQRSGTTALARLIAGSPGFTRYSLTSDDELDAALILSGLVNLPRAGRYCFQTTYVNENYSEYAALGPEQRLIWITREPTSVIYSMVHNWSRFALNELYVTCGETPSTEVERWRKSRYPWPLGASRLEQAASAYSGKAAHLAKILQLVDRTKVLIVDYSALVNTASTTLREVFNFIDEPYDGSYENKLSASGASKRSSRKLRRVETVSWGRPQAVYERVRLLSSGQCDVSR